MTYSVHQRTASVNGVDLVVHESGDHGAPLIILAHGFPETAHSWRHQMIPLAEAGYHVIAPDQRGYGRSSVPKNVDAYSTTDLALDLLHLAEQAGHEKTIYVGHDWGACCYGTCVACTQNECVLAPQSVFRLPIGQWHQLN